MSDHRFQAHPRPPDPLPIDEVLGDVRATLRSGSRLAVSAPPGAGKTTRLPLALLDEPWTTGRLILLEPRRIAARAAAERMSRSLNAPLGDVIGLRTRAEVRTSPRARIEVVTEGVFTRMILDDPALDGVSGVLLDEFHERSLDADLALALILDAQSVLRDDLRLIVMSATLDVGRIAAFIDAPVVASEGRAHPVETRYLGSTPHARIEDEAAAAVRRALAEEEGSILVFLPGAAEIRRTAERLGAAAAAGVVIAPLHGTLEPRDQQTAIAPAPEGGRKVVLATDIAESSLTIEGVRIVIDCGLARVPRFDPALGASRLETVRIARANADQRRGRAGRTEAGVCYRLWREAETQGMEPHAPADILNADLSRLAIDLARWGARSPEALRFLDPPAAGPWAAARGDLERAGAITADGGLTPLGERLAALPLPPRLALMVLRAEQAGCGALGADLAALLSERDLGGRALDLADRLARFRRDDGDRARRMRRLAASWTAKRESADGRASGCDAGAVLAAGFPERIGKARAGQPGRFLLAGGRGVMMPETEPLAAAGWIVAADVTGAGPDLRVTAAVRLEEADALAHGGLEERREVRFDAGSGALRSRQVRRLGAIVLDERPTSVAPGPDTVAALIEAVRIHGTRLVDPHGDLGDLAARVAHLRSVFGEPWPDGFGESLLRRLDDWLAPLLDGAVGFDRLDRGTVSGAARSLLDWPLPRDLDRLAPQRWRTPAGREVDVSYGGEVGPVARCKVQEAFGLAVHPAVADGLSPLTLELLSPAGRVVAATRDLPAFWRAGYLDVRKDLRGRYPKHDWPEDPASATPTSRAKSRN
ncbi:ATP-dependent helicase HrpB [bacterium]|nr:ATP-dependent helicase HrpB [bacterium]